MNQTLKRIRHLFPSPLPKSQEAFDALCNELFETYEIPNKPSYKHAVASMIMHLNTTKASMPLRYFVDSIRKAQANEIAYNVIQTIRDEDKKQQQEAINQNESHLECVQNETI
jgi:hypothetical protein